MIAHLTGAYCVIIDRSLGELLFHQEFGFQRKAANNELEEFT